ncbi:MAG: hypothetical protein ABJD38_05110 [Aurantimonas coralicida]
MSPSLSLMGGVLAALTVPVAALAGESVYTDLDLDGCETVAIAAEDGGSGEWICPGIEGRAVFVSEGDLRVSIGFGAVPEFQSFAPFNSLGSTIEWRVDERGAPYAAIVRYHLDGAEVGETSDVLLVSRVGNGETPGCAVAVLDAGNEQANGMARGAADLSTIFQCGRDRPVLIGTAGGPASSFGGLQ